MNTNSCDSFMDISPRQLEIIESTGKLLLAGGIYNLTTKNLANEMRFSEAALYRHFKSKDEIITMMLKHLSLNMDKRLREVLNNESNSIEKLSATFESQFHFFNTNKHFLVAIFSDGLWEKNENIHNAVKGVMAVKRKYLDTILTQGIENNEFTLKVDKASLIHISMATFRLHMLKWKMNNYDFDVEEGGKKIIGDLLLLIKK